MIITMSLVNIHHLTELQISLDKGLAQHSLWSKTCEEHFTVFWVSSFYTCFLLALFSTNFNLFSI